MSLDCLLLCLASSSLSIVLQQLLLQMLVVEGFHRSFRHLERSISSILISILLIPVV